MLGDASVGVKWTACDALRLSAIPDCNGTMPQAINDHGVIVGDEWAGPSTMAVMWDPTLQFRELPLQATESRALAVNNCGDVTGHRTVGGVEHAYLWHPGRAEQ